MGVFTYVLTIPPAIAEPGRAEIEAEIEGTVLRRVSVLIPSGHQALAGMRIRYGARSILPIGENSWLSGDNESLTFELHWPLPESPCTLIIEGRNDDMCYPHSFYIRIETDTEETVRPEDRLASFINLLAYFMGLPVGEKYMRAGR